MFAASPPPRIHPTSPRISSADALAPPSSPPSVRFRPARIVAAYASPAERTTNSTTCLSPPPPKLASLGSSLYDVLGLPIGASGLEIKAAYRSLARTFHPDVAAVGGRDSSSEEFIKIHAAYSTLSDPVKRADYDRKLLPRRRLFRSYSDISDSSVRFSSYTTRNWETDQCW